MKKTAIKLICLVMATIMIFCLAGCGGSSNNKVVNVGTEDFDIEGNADVNNGGDAATDNNDAATSSGDQGSSDGKITAADARKILRKSAKLE